MSWKPAPCGVALSDELDDVFGAERPNDGTVGDLAHSARASDHNPKKPRPPGWVDARDVYDWTSPKTGRTLDANTLMIALAAARDRRILYVISHGRMCSSYPTSRYAAWAWRPYTGANGHFSHGHISFQPEHRADTSRWLSPAVLAALGLAAPKPAPAPLEEDDMPGPTIYTLHRLDDDGHPSLKRGQLAAEAPGLWSVLDGDELAAARYAKRLLPLGDWGSENNPVTHSAAGFEAMRRLATGADA